MDSVAEGPGDLRFGRWWAFSGGRISAYVRASASFVGDRLLPDVRRVQQVFAADGAKVRCGEHERIVVAHEMNRLALTVLRDFERDYYDIFERLWDLPQSFDGTQFTPAQRREFPEHIRLIERAEAFRRLFQSLWRLLLERPPFFTYHDAIARLDECARRLEASLETDDSLLEY
jgi:hypothetical protein